MRKLDKKILYCVILECRRGECWPSRNSAGLRIQNESGWFHWPWLRALHRCKSDFTYELFWAWHRPKREASNLFPAWSACPFSRKSKPEQKKILEKDSIFSTSIEFESKSGFYARKFKYLEYFIQNSSQSIFWRKIVFCPNVQHLNNFE